MLRSTRALPAVMLAAVVLLVAMAGGATAAKMITGKQIKNGTVTTFDLKNNDVRGVDLKNGTVGFADLHSSARTTLKVDADRNNFLEVPACSDTTLEACTNLLTVGIVPGSQLVTLSAEMDNNAPGVPAISNRCGLVQGGDVLTEARFALAANGAPGEVAHFTLQQVITVPDASQPVHLRCTQMGGEDLRLSEPTLTSIKVDKAS
ncbi:MAG: hypothetical protein Q8O61_19370 [Nocardioides sp.]|nr:hypothetical protein [Nocardioides sp.]